MYYFTWTYPILGENMELLPVIPIFTFFWTAKLGELYSILTPVSCGVNDI